MDESKLVGKVHEKATPVFLTSKSDIAEHYREQYGSKKWTSEAAKALSGTSDKNSKEYKAAIRQFQGSRLQQAGKILAPRFEQVGQHLPPSGYIPKDNQITVTVTGNQADGKGGSRERSFTVKLTGSDAHDFVNKPTLRTMLRAMGYPDRVIDLIEDGTYELSISGVS